MPDLMRVSRIRREAGRQKQVISNRAIPRMLLTLSGTALSMIIAITLLLSCCGGGGGGGGGGGTSTGGCVSKVTAPSNPTLATISGFVYDTAHNPVVGASVTVNETGSPGSGGLGTITDSCGKFVITNVPLTAISLSVASPNPVNYYNYANYNGKLYDLIDCTLPLPTLNAGANAPYTEIDMYLGGPNNPPPQPPTGCPT